MISTNHSFSCHPSHGRRKWPCSLLDFEHFSKKRLFSWFRVGKTNFTTFAPSWKNFGKIPWWPPLEKILPTPMTRAQFMSLKCSYYNTGQGSATNLTSVLQNHPNQLSAFILVSLPKIIVSLTVSIIMSTVTNQNVNYLRVLSRISVFIVTASFALWQQATIEFTRRDHSVIAFSRHAYMVLFFAHIPFVVNRAFRATRAERLQHYQLHALGLLQAFEESTDIFIEVTRLIGDRGGEGGSQARLEKFNKGKLCFSGQPQVAQKFLNDEKNFNIVYSVYIHLE